MTRMYLTPITTTFVKVCLIIIECFIELFNLITLPLRKMTFKTYIGISLISGAFRGLMLGGGLENLFVSLALMLVLYAAVIFTACLVYKILKKKISPKIACLINTPMGIPLNRFYEVEK